MNIISKTKIWFWKDPEIGELKIEINIANLLLNITKKIL